MKTFLKQEVIESLLVNDSLCMKVCIDIDIKLNTFKNWLEGNKKGLTNYETLLSISWRLGRSVDDIVDIEYTEEEMKQGQGMPWKEKEEE